MINIKMYSSILRALICIFVVPNILCIIQDSNSTNIEANQIKRPSLFRSASTSMKQYIVNGIWSEEMTRILIDAYSATQGFQEGKYFGRSQMISDHITQVSGKFRSPSEIKRKLNSLNLEI